jgi:hypothetical protein
MRMNGVLRLIGDKVPWFGSTRKDGWLIAMDRSTGADDYIVKPFDEAALRAKLEKLGRGQTGLRRPRP